MRTNTRFSDRSYSENRGSQSRKKLTMRILQCETELDLELDEKSTEIHKLHTLSHTQLKVVSPWPQKVTFLFH